MGKKRDPNAGVGDELNTLTIARILEGFDRRDITMHKLKNIFSLACLLE
jgi:hypothetical protein